MFIDPVATLMHMDAATVYRILVMLVLPTALLVTIGAVPSQAAETNVVTPGIEWQNLLGGSNGDVGHSIQPTTDGGYVLLGSSGSNWTGDVMDTTRGGSDYWIVKQNVTGAIQWQRLLGSNWNEEGYSVRQTTDGGFILIGRSPIDGTRTGDITVPRRGGGDIWVVKLNATGAIQWQTLLGGNGIDKGYSVQQTADGGYILIGDTRSSASGDVTTTNHGYDDLWVVKLDSGGVIQWQRLLGGSGHEYGRDVQQTADGGYILLGYSDSEWRSENYPNFALSHGQYDVWVVKLDGAGTFQWQKLLGGTQTDNACSIQQTADGGYVLLGESISSRTYDVTGTNHGSSDLWVVKLDSTGSIQWQKLLGGDAAESGHAIQQTTDGGYVLVGDSRSSANGDVTGMNHGTNYGYYDLWVVKLDGGGVIQWEQLLGGSGNDSGHSVLQTADGGYILLGYSDSNWTGDILATNHGHSDFWVVKLLDGVPPPPTSISITPNSGIQGSIVAITNLAGTGFQDGATVKLTMTPNPDIYPDILATNVVVVSPTQIICEIALPSTAQIGLWNVVVTNPDGYFSILPHVFKTNPPDFWVTAITPNEGEQGSTVAITNLAGTGFVSGAKVEIGSSHGTFSATNVVVVSPTQITCQFTLPSTVYAFWNVVVTNPDGTWATLENGFATTPMAPTAAFTATPRSGSAPLAVQFTDTSIGTPTSWSWTFGDGHTSTLQHPSNIYARSGTYTVNLTVTNAEGQDDERKIDHINVTTSPPPVLTVPGGTDLPRDVDLDANGLYEDVNGNGRTDFADVVLYFNQMTWIADHEPVALFDYNGNGRVDFADVVWLFNNL